MNDARFIYIYIYSLRFLDINFDKYVIYTVSYECSNAWTIYL